MNTDFILPLHFKNITQSTQDFSDEEFGAYVRLLIYQWDKGFIPSEMSRLNRIAESCEKNWKALSEKFEKSENGVLKNKRMEIIRKEKNEFSSKKSTSGKLGAEKRWQTHGKQDNKQDNKQDSKQDSKQDGEQIANDMANGITKVWPSPSPLPSSLPSSNPSKGKKDAPDKPSLFFMPMKEVFLKVIADRELEYFFSAKDGANLKKIEVKILFLFKEKTKNKETPNIKQVTETWEYILRSTKNKYILENFTIPVINSKWNELVNEAKQAKNGTRDEKLKREFGQLDKKIDEFYADKPD